MSWRRFYLGLIYSVLLHLFVFLALSFYKPSPFAPPPAPVEVTILEKPPAETPERETGRQVVDQADRPINDERPEKADYLEKYDQTVTKQTKAPKVGRFSNRRGGRPPAVTQKSAGKKTAKKPAEPARQKQREGEKVSLENLKPQFDWNRFDSDSSAGGEGGPAQTDDHLKGVEIGVETALNTHEFLYHSYYSRIKEKVRSQWEPKVREHVERLRQFGRDPASIPVDKVTKLIVVLDATGAIRNIRVIGRSGEPELDNAAIEAFKAASPFPNPPKGMIDEDGTIILRWNFILEA